MHDAFARDRVFWGHGDFLTLAHLVTITWRLIARKKLFFQSASALLYLAAVILKIA
jgi:hypothetical protein